MGRVMGAGSLESVTTKDKGGIYVALRARGTGWLEVTGMEF